MDLITRLATLAAAWRADATAHGNAAQFFKDTGNAQEAYIKQGQSAVAMAHAQQVEALLRDVEGPVYDVVPANPITARRS